MHKLKLASIALAALLISAAVTFAAGTLPWSGGQSGAQVQNLKAIAPTAGKSRCDTSASSTKGVYKNYSVSGYLGATATVTDSAGAAVPVVWKENDTEVWVGSTYDVVNNQNGTQPVTTLRFDQLSSATKRTLKSCVRRQ